MTTTPPERASRGPRTRFRRKVAGVLALGIGLLGAGVGYTVLTPAPQVATAQGDAALIAKGQQLGTLKISVGDQPLRDVPLVALEAVEPAGLFGRAWDAIRLWIK